MALKRSTSGLESRSEPAIVLSCVHRSGGATAQIRLTSFLRSNCCQVDGSDDGLSWGGAENTTWTGLAPTFARSAWAAGGAGWKATTPATSANTATRTHRGTTRNRRCLVDRM